MFVPSFLGEDPELPQRLQARCRELARVARAEGKDITPLWDGILNWARERAAVLEQTDPDTARDFLGMYFDIVAECRNQT